MTQSSTPQSYYHWSLPPLAGRTCATTALPCNKASMASEAFMASKVSMDSKAYMDSKASVDILTPTMASSLVVPEVDPAVPHAAGEELGVEDEILLGGRHTEALQQDGLGV